MEIIQRFKDQDDGSQKFLFSNVDGHRFEGVYLPGKQFYGYCTSSQVGCNMGCTFCATGLKRNTHNITSDEMLESIRLMEDEVSSNLELGFVTLSGMGEPLANYENATSALERMKLEYPSLNAVSLSTIGLRNGMNKLVEEKRDFRIYISLHATEDSARERIIPLAREYPISELLDTADKYGQLNGPQNCHISYLLLKEVNDTEEDLKRLTSLMQGRSMLLQLLLWNNVDGLDFDRVDDELASRWVEVLQENDVFAYAQPSMGRSIDAACGQLTS